MSINFEDALHAKRKAKQLRDYFNKYGRIFILVDATSHDVQLPDALKGDVALPLVLNSRMPQPIYIKDTHLESNFSFSGIAHQCVIPMSRIWAAYLPDSDLSSGLVWDDAMPETMKLVQHKGEESEMKTKDAEAAHQHSMKISAVDKPKVVRKALDQKANKEGKGGKRKSEISGRKTGHLRVIK